MPKYDTILEGIRLRIKNTDSSSNIPLCFICGGPHLARKCNHRNPPEPNPDFFQCTRNHNNTQTRTEETPPQQFQTPQQNITAPNQQARVSTKTCFHQMATPKQPPPKIVTSRARTPKKVWWNNTHQPHKKIWKWRPLQKKIRIQTKQPTLKIPNTRQNDYLNLPKIQIDITETEEVSNDKDGWTTVSNKKTSPNKCNTLPNPGSWLHPNNRNDALEQLKQRTENYSPMTFYFTSKNPFTTLGMTF